MKQLVLAAIILAFGNAAYAAAPPKEAMPDFGAVLPTANVEAGRQVAVQCQQCHDTTSTKLNQFGPPLWNMVNRPRATAPGFQYSSGMKASYDPWTYERLFVYLRSPQLVVRGTPMSFGGVRNAKTRINLIAYLRTLSDNPAPIAPAAGK